MCKIIKKKKKREKKKIKDKEYKGKGDTKFPEAKLFIEGSVVTT